jgi:hypothetical protein
MDNYNAQDSGDLEMHIIQEVQVRYDTQGKRVCEVRLSRNFGITISAAHSLPKRGDLLLLDALGKQYIIRARQLFPDSQDE